MDTTLVVAVGASWICGWLTKEYFTTKPEIAPCKCECACVQKGEGGGVTSGWVICSISLAVLVVVATQAALAFKITVTSREGVREVDFSVKGKSKGIYGPVRGLQILG